MNILKEICTVRQILSPALFNPNIIAVRFAKRKIKQSKLNYEFTDMAYWRKEKGMTTNPNRFGPLTNLPDYSFLDGRPVPLGSNFKTRLEKQQEYAETIVRLSSELDFAKESYQEKQRHKQETRDNIIKNKLKRKGSALSKKN